MLTRRALLVGLGAAATSWGCGGGRPWKPQAEAALTRGVDGLWALQREDGAFASARYGLMGDGWSLTPLALLAMVRANRGLRPAETSRALGWIAHGTRKGALGMAGATPDYPVYATAMALHCFAEIRPPDWKEHAAPMQAWLRTMQLRKDQGWTGHPAQGAFRMGSSDVPRPPHSGHVDLSMTRHAVEALRAAGAAVDDRAVVEALDFARRCRTPEGAFVYTAAQTALNKGRKGADPGYGSATADGSLLLHAAGTGDCEQAVAVLRAMHRADQNPLVGDGPMRPYARAMRGYYRAAAARVFAARGGPAGWQQALCTAVLADQQPDGTWANDRAEQREDEPIIATAFALIALSSALGAAP